jgi:hypothetical protein
MAAGSRPVNPSPIIRVVPRPGAAAVGAVAMTALGPDPSVLDTALLGRSPSGSGSPTPVALHTDGATAATVQARISPALGRARTAVL